MTYFGGANTSSKNSSILLMSVLTSPLYVRKGGCVPGARLCRSAGFLNIKISQENVLQSPETKNPKCVCEIIHKTAIYDKNSILSQWIGNVVSAGFSPLQVHSGDVEDNPFEPQDHEEALRKRAVPDALPITSSLQTTEQWEINLSHMTRPSTPLLSDRRLYWITDKSFLLNKYYWNQE